MMYLWYDDNCSGISADILLIFNTVFWQWPQCDSALNPVECHAELQITRLTHPSPVFYAWPQTPRKMDVFTEVSFTLYSTLLCLNITQPHFCLLSSTPACICVEFQNCQFMWLYFFQLKSSFLFRSISVGIKNRKLAAFENFNLVISFRF